MKRRTALLLAVTAAAGAAGVSAPSRVAANTNLCPQPNITGLSQQVAPAQTSITINGSGFTAIGCNIKSVTVGGAPAGQVTAVTSGAITFTAATGLHGGVQVVIQDTLGGTNVSNGNVAFYSPASTSGVSPGAPAAGQGTTVDGSGFALGLPAGFEHVSAAYLWGDGSSCAGASASVASDSAISLSAPGHYCDGPVSLAISAPADLSNPTGALLPLYRGHPGSVDVAATGMQLPTPTATAGGSVSVQGSGFGTDGTASLGGATVPSSWSDTGVTVNVPDTSVSNSQVVLTRSADGATIAVPGAVTVVARVDGVSPSSASPGSAVTISGGGFGTHPGTVALGSTNLPVSSWAPASIVATVPSGAQSGNLTITPVDTSPPSSQPGLGVVQPIRIGPGTGGAAGTGGSTSGGSGSSQTAPLTPAQVQQVTAALSAPPPSLPPPVVGGPPPALPPSHPTNGPISLSLHTQSKSAVPGKSVPFTVTLRAYGKPVGGAAVQLVIAYEPAPDGSVTPTSGVTDDQGQLHGVVHLSKVPGEMIILARTGMFSDEVQLLGSKSAAAAANGAASFSSTLQHNLPIAVIALAALFLLTGLGLRVALAMGTGRGLRTALLRERLSAGARFDWLRRRVLRRTRSWHDVQAGGDAPAEAGVPGHDEPTFGLSVIDGDAPPQEAKEGVEVGA
jgi:hypothetical protein